MNLFFLEHLRALMNSLGQLSRSLWATLLTFAVIGIALAFPLGLSIAIKNIQLLSGSLNSSGQISVYLDNSLNGSQANQLLNTVQKQPGVNSAQYISPQQGLQEFATQSGFNDLLKTLPANPLPGVITIQPSAALSTIQVEQLISQLEKLPGVTSTELDMKWLQRLQAILQIGHRAATLLLIIFAIAVVLIIGNTIRLTTQAHHDEILVIKLIGGSNAFIRRPFLYSGILYGLGGALVAWLLIQLMLLALEGPISTLAGLYESSFSLAGLSIGASFLLITGASLLGLIASWLAVNRYINKIEPR